MVKELQELSYSYAGTNRIRFKGSGIPISGCTAATPQESEHSSKLHGALENCRYSKPLSAVRAFAAYITSLVQIHRSRPSGPSRHTLRPLCKFTALGRPGLRGIHYVYVHLYRVKRRFDVFVLTEGI